MRRNKSYRKWAFFESARHHQSLGADFVSQTCFILHEMLGEYSIRPYEHPMKFDFNFSNWISRFVVGWFDLKIFI